MAFLTRDSDSPNVGFPPPLVFVGFLLIGCAIDDLFGLNPAISNSVRVVLGGGAILIGCAFVLGALLRFRKAGNNPEPWKRDTAFVAEGVYRITRNPMYLGMVIASFGIAVAANCLGGLLTLPLSIVAIHTQVIRREESYLSATFGDEYREYCRHVRRWI
ncbi:isoprenylcysteine carboxylmethyltransferase family protein [Croceicoccus ponticola]|uniref:Isoprenylcysteine carboxylmethyltransferase family protein n=1 Tax=Croceicoccus ponticola TaxID=2217664 RepID=A0A437GUX7_9SPHN|nr:isoprenylcysteine carboxylmethyltransferase family protein [Croceicoccus ponticola]RVQ65471.1 isoprenylcysteine carboxylmethyltransferase family protein [Croceicoccus ponticola]